MSQPNVTQKVPQPQQQSQQAAHSQSDMVLSCIINTKFYGHIRYKLNGNLSLQQTKELLAGIDSLSRHKNKETISCTIDQLAVFIVVYGEVEYNGKTYYKGDYFAINQPNQRKDSVKSKAASRKQKIHNALQSKNQINEQQNDNGQNEEKSNNSSRVRSRGDSKTSNSFMRQRGYSYFEQKYRQMHKQKEKQKEEQRQRSKLIQGSPEQNKIPQQPGQQQQKPQKMNSPISLSLTFHKPTTLILFNEQILYHRIEQLLAIRGKMAIVEKCMPVKQLKLTQSQVRKLAKNIQIEHVTGKYTSHGSKEGLYLFYDGIFQICTAFTNGKKQEENRSFNYNPTLIPFLQLQSNFLQQNFQKSLTFRLKTNQGSFAFISNQVLSSIISNDSLCQIQKNCKNKLSMKDNCWVMEMYLKEAWRLRQKFKQKTYKYCKNLIGKQDNAFRYQNKSMQDQVKNRQRIALQASRRTMLQKCSTIVTVSKSLQLKSSRKTTYSSLASSPTKIKSSRKLNQTSRQFQIQKISAQNVQKFETQESMTANKVVSMQNLQTKGAMNLTSISKRLNKMREHSTKKQKTQTRLGFNVSMEAPNAQQLSNDPINTSRFKLNTSPSRQKPNKYQKQWYYLDDQKMIQTRNLTYYQIRKHEKKMDFANQMTNYKRVHRIYSDPCFKKPINFRTLY